MRFLVIEVEVRGLGNSKLKMRKCSHGKYPGYGVDTN
jgi:hypothetical protein